MKTQILLAIAAVQTTVWAAEFPQQALTGTVSVSFGQTLESVELALGTKAVPDPLPVSRPGVDMLIEWKSVRLQFDSARLNNIMFGEGFDFSLGLSAYPEGWRNFAAFGDLRVQGGMSKQDFMRYLEEWERRAQAAGAVSVTEKRLLGENEYHIQVREIDSRNSIYIRFGPERKTSRGGIWGDGCGITFVSEDMARFDNKPVGSLKSISVFRDEFNTVAR